MCVCVCVGFSAKDTPNKFQLGQKGYFGKTCGFVPSSATSSMADFFDPSKVLHSSDKGGPCFRGKGLLFYSVQDLEI